MRVLASCRLLRLAGLILHRVAVSSLLDLESKYNRAIEEKTLLEQEIVQKTEVEEDAQRLRDELRGESLNASPLPMIAPASSL